MLQSIMGLISPEMKRLPGLIKDFSQNGPLNELLFDIYHGDKQRDFVHDMAMMTEKTKLQIEGLENIPLTGGLAVFNHPEIHIIAPALFKLAVMMEEHLGQDLFSIVMGSEIPLTPWFYVPFSPSLIQKFAALYPQTFILVPTYKYHPDYHQVRAGIGQRIVEKTRNKRLVFISPEGRVGESGAIQEKQIYRKGCGTIAQRITALDKPIVPIGVWQENETIRINIGSPFSVYAPGSIGSISAMREIAALLPNNLRGPFKR